MAQENEETQKHLDWLISCIRHPDTIIKQEPHKNTPDEDRDDCKTIHYSVSIRQDHLFSVQRFTRGKNTEHFANNLVYSLFDDQGKLIYGFTSEQEKQIFDAVASQTQFHASPTAFWEKIETYAKEVIR